MDYVHQQGIAVGANLHDAAGINPWEAQFNAACAAMGLDPTKTKNIPFDLTNKEYVYTLEDVVLKAVEDDGMDFWCVLEASVLL